MVEPEYGIKSRHWDDTHLASDGSVDTVVDSLDAPKSADTLAFLEEVVGEGNPAPWVNIREHELVHVLGAPPVRLGEGFDKERTWMPCGSVAEDRTTRDRQLGRVECKEWIRIYDFSLRRDGRSVEDYGPGGCTWGLWAGPIPVRQAKVPGGALVSSG